MYSHFYCSFVFYHQNLNWIDFTDKKLHFDKKCSFRQQTVSQSACWRSMFVFYILKVNNLN